MVDFFSPSHNPPGAPIGPLGNLGLRAGIGALGLSLLVAPLAPAALGAEITSTSGEASHALSLTMNDLSNETLSKDGRAQHDLVKETLAEKPSPEQSEANQRVTQQEADLARQLANPVAALISIPFQWNWDDRIGAREDIQRMTLNIQPVVPISLSKDWNLISRTILPVIHQQDDNGRLNQGHFDNTLDFGDSVQSLFLSPALPGPRGWIWGVGPVALLPTGTTTFTTANQWALGPTGVLLKQRGPWTFGVLANHLWSVQNKGQLADINTSFMQPFISYTTPSAWSATLQTETTYDWQDQQWAVPINFVVTKILKIGDQLVSVGGGVRYWAEGPDRGPHGWAGRLVFTLLLPKKS